MGQHRAFRPVTRAETAGEAVDPAGRAGKEQGADSQVRCAHVVLTAVADHENLVAREPQPGKASRKIGGSGLTVPTCQDRTTVVGIGSQPLAVEHCLYVYADVGENGDAETRRSKLGEDGHGVVIRMPGVEHAVVQRIAEDLSTPGPSASNWWKTREWASADRSRRLSGSWTRAFSQIRSRKVTSSARSGSVRSARCGQSAVEPLVGTALVDQRRVQVEDDAAHRSGQGQPSGESLMSAA